MKLRILSICAREPDGQTYSFRALALPSGECCVAYQHNQDAWFRDEGAIEANGLAEVEEIVDLGEVEEWSAQQIAHSVQQSAAEYGREQVPASLHAYLEAQS